MPPLEKGKKYLVRPKPGFPDRPNLDRIMNNPDIRQPPTAKFLGGTAFNFDSDTAALGVYTNLNKFYWVFTPVDEAMVVVVALMVVVVVARPAVEDTDAATVAKLVVAISKCRLLQVQALAKKH